MSGLLASVTNPVEALLALECGADVVDCKDPRRGALGDLAPAIIRQMVAAVRGRRPVSATVGDLPTDADILAPAIRRVAATGVDFVKLGLLHPDRAVPDLVALSPLARRHQLIAVLFADRAPGLGVIPALAAADFAGVMLDTADKGAGNLTTHASPDLLADFIASARHHRLMCALAGSLGGDQIPQLLPLGADYLGFRGALCEQGRGGVLSRRRLELVRKAMSPERLVRPRGSPHPRRTDTPSRPVATSTGK